MTTTKKLETIEEDSTKTPIVSMEDTIEEILKQEATTNPIVSMEEEYYNQTKFNITEKSEYIKKLKDQEKKFEWEILLIKGLSEDKQFTKEFITEVIKEKKQNKQKIEFIQKVINFQSRVLKHMRKKYPELKKLC